MLKAFLARFGLDIFSRAIILGVNIFLARFLRVSDYGIFSYLLALVNTFYVFTEMGINSYILREVGKNPNTLAMEWRRAVILKLFLGFLVIFLFFVLSPLIWKGQILLLLLAALWMLSNSFSDLYQSLSNARHDFVLAGRLLLVFRGPFILAIIGMFLFVRVDLFRIFWIYSLSGLTGVFLISKIFARNFQINFYLPAFKDVRQLLLCSWPLGLGGLLTTLYLRIDLILIKWFSGYVATGNYAAVYRFFEIFYIMATALTVILMPLLSRPENKEKFQRYLRRAFQFSLVITLAWLLVSMLFSGQLVKLVYGLRYLAAAPVLKILALANMFAFWGQISSGALIVLRKQKEYVLTQGITLGAGVFAGIILISRWGIFGAALTALFVQFGNWLLNYLILQRTLKDYANRN